MKLSIVIVNYNVAYFLEQCLNSVFKALQHIEGEVFVVDNNSIDNSVEIIQQKFPNVRFIQNKENVGFSKANNQAIKFAIGEYILLLNPDTVVEETTFVKTIKFFDNHPNAGGLGVRMLDGKGKFLPESKRGLPSPGVAFSKIIGLSRLFPNSKIFNRYHLGYLSEFKTHKVDVLSGAFMMIRNEIIQKIGALDESFFMYGEDIDLSYRIQLAGYDNYYYPETSIIHYKGESTKKSSVNYVFVFYNAMIIFAKKHFSSKNARLFSILINMAIYLRASIALFQRFIRKATLPLFDGVLLISGLYSLTIYWKNNGIEFPLQLIKFALPIYTGIWMLANYYQGTYDKLIRIKKIIAGTFIGTFCILALYALLPKSLQFSRLFIIASTLFVCCYFILSRYLLQLFFKSNFAINEAAPKKIIIVGSENESLRVSKILHQVYPSLETIFFVALSSDLRETSPIGDLSQLDQITYIHKINEVLFCAKDVSAQQIIHWMSTLGNSDIEFKIAQPDALFIIGSNSTESSGEFYSLEIHEISKAENKRKKRTLDLLFSMFFFLTLPITIFYFKQKKNLLINIIDCFLGKKTYVGYNLQNSGHPLLPKLKLSILHPIPNSESSDDLLEKINLIYARDYSIWKDIEIIQKKWKQLDRKIV